MGKMQTRECINELCLHKLALTVPLHFSNGLEGKADSTTDISPMIQSLVIPSLCVLI